MKSVFIVTDGDYSDYHIEAVFDNVKDAENYCYVHKLSARNIEEYSLNPAIEKLNFTPVEALEYWVRYSKSPFIRTDINRTSLFVDPKKIGTVEFIEGDKYAILKTYFSIDVNNFNYDKFASDRFAPYLNNMMNEMKEKI